MNRGRCLSDAVEQDGHLDGEPEVQALRPSQARSHEPNEDEGRQAEEGKWDDSEPPHEKIEPGIPATNHARAAASMAHRTARSNRETGGTIAPSGHTSLRGLGISGSCWAQSGGGNEPTEEPPCASVGTNENLAQIAISVSQYITALIPAPGQRARQPTKYPRPPAQTQSPPALVAGR